MAQSCDLSIVLPRLHESRAVVDKTIYDLLRLRSEISIEILIVNDGGNIDDLIGIGGVGDNVRVLDNSLNRGKGFSVRRGVLAARGRYIFFSDVDLPIRSEEILTVYRKVSQSGIQVMIGRRVRATESPQANIYRVATSKIFIFLFRIILQTKISDPQCPFKMFERVAAIELFGELAIDRYAFDSEIIFKAHKLKIALLEVDVQWLDLRQGWSLAHSIVVLFKMSFDLIQIRRSWNSLSSTSSSSSIEKQSFL